MNKKTKLLLSMLTLLTLTSCSSHTHTFATTWSYDNAQHWHPATCEHTDERSGVANHTIGSDGKCSVCGYDSIIRTVTKQEWEAAWHTEKPFFMGDNFKLEMTTNIDEQSSLKTFTVDGIKVKDTQSYDGGEEINYYCYEQNEYFRFHKKSDETWEKKSCTNPALDFARFLEPVAASYTSFTYDETSLSYRCDSLTFSGTTLTDLVTKFENKNVVHVSFKSQKPLSVLYVIDINFVYGGQSVTLPPVDPVGDTYYECVLDGSFIMRMDEKREIKNVNLDVSNTVSFVYVNGESKTPLTALAIDGPNTYGFNISSGVFTPFIAGEYSFKLNGSGTSCSLSVIGNIPAKYTGAIFMGGDSPVLGAPFLFSKVENDFVEYKTEPSEIPEVDVTLTLQIHENGTALPVTLLSSPANDDFQLSSDNKTLTYIAKERNTYVFTVKESLLGGGLLMLIEKI